MPSGAAPGERRGGRAVGTPNKSTVDIRAIADAIANNNGGWGKLFERFVNSENEDVAFKAAQLVCAYRFGKPKESVMVDVSDDMVNLISEARQRANQKEQ